MKKYILSSLVVVFSIWLIFATASQAKASGDSVIINCIVDKLSVSEGDSVLVVVTITNPKKYELTDVAIEYEGREFAVVKKTNAPSKILPFSSYKGTWTLESIGTGKQNIVFSVAYTWQDKETHNEIVVVATEQVEINPSVSIRWPDYLLPLIIGIVSSQLVSWINNWINEGKEKKKQEEQARGVLLAILHSAKWAVENQSKVSFGLWEESVIKANLFPAVYRLGLFLKKPDITRRLAELSINIADYNQRHDQKNVTEAIRSTILSEINDLIKVLEYGA